MPFLFYFLQKFLIAHEFHPQKSRDFYLFLKKLPSIPRPIGGLILNKYLITSLSSIYTSTFRCHSCLEYALSVAHFLSRPSSLIALEITTAIFHFL